jgi:hypothetical protein
MGSLEVVLVDTGELRNVDNADNVADVLAIVTGVANGDQILLNERGEKLAASTLGAAPQKRIYLFNRRVLGAGAAPAQVSYNLDEIVTPEHSSLRYSAAATSTPALAVIQTYERTFCLQLDQAIAIADACAARGSFVHACQANAHQQVQGMQVAIMNLTLHTQEIKFAMSEFMEKFHSESAKHCELLYGLDGHLAAVRAVSLGTSLAATIEANQQEVSTGGPVTSLADCCEDETQIRKHAQECATFTESLKTKIDLMPAVITKLQREVRKINAAAGCELMSATSTPNAAGYRKTDSPCATPIEGDTVGVEVDQSLEALLGCDSDVCSQIDRQVELVSELAADHDKISAMLEAGASGSLDLSKFDERHNVHENFIGPELRTLAEAIGVNVTRSVAARYISFRTAHWCISFNEGAVDQVVQLCPA